jgi:hypothetical protein
VNGIGIILISIAAGLVLFGRPVTAALGVMFAVCYITQAQAVEVAGFNFTAIRIVLLVGIVRALMKGELREMPSSPVDKWLIGYTVTTLLIAAVTQGSEVIPFYIGLNYNVLLAYFVFRALLKSRSDLLEFLSLLALLIVPMACSMLYEAATGYNIFKNLGGIKDNPVVREGAFRCQGAFRISITGGIFGATLVPLFVGLYMATIQRARANAVVGIIAGLIITFTSNSSGPLMALINGILALGFWYLRANMRMVRWAAVVLLLSLSLLMNAPVYYLIARSSDFVGGDGWHRARLIEQFINHTDDWLLAGTTDTGDWMPTALVHGDKRGADLTNKFVAVGVEGGIVPLILYVCVFVVSYKVLGRALSLARLKSPQYEPILWGFGCALFAHIMALVSVQYWDQMDVAFCMFLAIIACSPSYVIEESESNVVEGEIAEPIREANVYPC